MRFFNKWNQEKIEKVFIDGQFDFLIKGLETGKIDPNMKIYGTPFLNEACRKLGTVTLIQKLIEKGVDVNQFDMFTRTPVMIVIERYLGLVGEQDDEALKNENERLLTLLKEAGADFNKRDGEDKTPLERLIQRAHPVYYRNAMPNGYVDFFNNYWKKAELLIRYGANINAKDKNGKTPLMEAVQQRSFGAVKFLIQNGADVNLADEKGETAVMQVVQDWYLNNIQIKNNKGMLTVDETQEISDTSLVIQNRLLKILEYLISAGADLVQKNKEGLDVYNLAMKKGHGAVAKVIIKCLQRQLKGSPLYGRKISKSGLIKTLNPALKREKE
ncbi:MAG: ankyrin repeat domain-containing protein [Alphaproteobacteria bacterium]|nr:ankyrin repeat domain-containing protein [Alphaproteobacteria bacterium]